jgi:Ca2+-binding RTX toxin-like protein
VGDDGDNILWGNAGDDLMDGRAGVDWVSYFATSVAPGIIVNDPGPVEVDLAAETGIDHADGSDDRLVDLEAVLGSLGDDVLLGGGGENLLLGEEGNDHVDGRGGARDYVAGGPGDDELIGGPGKSDMASYTAEVAVSADLAAGTASTALGSDDLTGIEGIIGSFEGDALLGNGVRNWMFGRAGPDLILGRGGSDILDGEGGVEDVDGGGGIDFCLSVPNANCEESSLPPGVQAALEQIEDLEELAAKKKKGIKKFKK